MLYFSLCCLFHQENIKFKTYTKSSLLKLSKTEQIKKVSDTITFNISSLQEALNYCYKHNIKGYRFSSDLIPHFDFIQENNLFPHNFNELFSSINTYDINISCHPGQYNNIGSLTDTVVNNSLSDLNYHLLINSLITSNQPEINIHLGGTFGDKQSSMLRFINQINKNNLNNFITIENDELSYSVEDCLFVSKQTNLKVTMDLHHHNCQKLNPLYIPSKSDRDLFLDCKQTWVSAGFDFMRLHISSPKEGYSTPSKSRPHSDYIDFIPEWLFEEAKSFNIYLDVEAKHKELAIFALQKKYNLFLL